MTTTPDRTRPWLFDAYPDLEGSIPWIPLVNAPTPVGLLDSISTSLGREVWIKRDDLSSPLYGGNKPRKLEFLLGRALEQDKKILVTGGGLGTNHGLATTVFGRKLGLEVHLGLFGQPVTEHVRRNLLLLHAQGAQMAYLPSLLKGIPLFCAIQRSSRHQACFIMPGGSHPLGTLGYVDAGLELAGQIARKELPQPRVIFTALGSCGTMAGLVLGLGLAGLRTRVVGVQVAPWLAANRASVLWLARRTLGLIRDRDRTVPRLKVNPSEVSVDRDHYGPGYGYPTEAGKQAIALMADTEGILLEPTYTGKAFGCLMNFIETDTEKGPVLFWNTYSSAKLALGAADEAYLSLPKEFHRFFETRPIS